MISKDFGKTTVQRRWTIAAIDCYKRGCNCQGCFYNNFLSGNAKCQMKAAVLELVRVLGRPEGIKTKGAI